MARSVVNTPSIYSLGYLAIMLLSTVFSLYYSFYYIDTLGLGSRSTRWHAASTCSGMPRCSPSRAT